MQTDTINLLRECNAGIKMGEDAIKQVLPHVRNNVLCNTHELLKNAPLGDKTHALLIIHCANDKAKTSRSFDLSPTYFKKGLSHKPVKGNQLSPKIGY